MQSSPRARNQYLAQSDASLSKLFDGLNIKIIRELVNNPNISSTEIAAKYSKPLSTIQRRRARLEKSLLTKSYKLDIRQLGWRTADLLISVEKGKAEETAKKILEELEVNVVTASLRIGHPQVDVMAEVFYKDSVELHGLTERIKGMPYVTFVEWAEVVKVVGSNFGTILDKVFGYVAKK